MEIEDWAASSGGSSDSEATAPDSDNEEHCYAYSDLPKLQFRKDTSKACWKEELGMAEIVSNKGQMWTTTGIVRGGKIYSFLEDILFLAEIGALHLFDDEDKCIPLEDIYKKVAEGVGGSSWESFEVYRHLKSLGYIIKRHGICWSMKCAKSVPASVEGESGSQRIIDNGKEDRSSITDITELFSTMQINEARLVFDVYPPNSKFRKSSPGNPIFVLCIKSCNPPSRKQIEDLEGKCEGIPLKFCYVEHGRMTGVTDILVGPGDPKTLHPDADWLERTLRETKPTPKLVTVVNPGNPSGTYIPELLLKKILDICKDAGCWLVVDNTYEYFMYDGLKHSCIEGNHIVNIFSFSKAYGMMGWRVGYIAFPSEVEGLAQLLKIQDNIPICASIISRRLEIILSMEVGSQWVTDQVKDLVKNRQLLVDALIL